MALECVWLSHTSQFFALHSKTHTDDYQKLSFTHSFNLEPNIFFTLDKLQTKAKLI